MVETTNLLLLLVILVNFFTLGSARLIASIKAVALQGALLALLPVAAHGLTPHSLLLGAIALLLKGLLVPWLLLRAIREVRLRREIESRLGFVPTMVLGVLATSAAFIFADRLPLIPAHQGSLLIPTSLATICCGFLLLILRRKALTQVLGFLVLENGIFIFSVLLLQAMPLAVESGVLLDLLVCVFVMGVVINQINREFASINTERLSALKG